MADYRQIHTCIWKDSWFLELSSDHKLLFIYLFSNERANLTGLYDLSIKVMVFETDLDKATIQAGLEQFERGGKVYYEDGMVWVTSLLRHNARNITSPKIQTHLKGTILTTRDCPLKARWIQHYNDMVASEYRIDTLYIPGAPSASEHVPAPVPDRVHVHDPDQSRGDAQFDSFNPPPSVRSYGDVTGQVCATWDIAMEIHKAVGLDPPALQKWEDTMHAWLKRGYSKRNITGLLDWYRDGIPEHKGNSNGRDSGESSTDITRRVIQELQEEAAHANNTS